MRAAAARQFVDFAGVGSRLFWVLQPGRFAFVEPALTDLPGIAGFNVLALLLGKSSLLIIVRQRIRLKALLAPDGVIDLLRRHHPLFHKPVRDHGQRCAVEEVQWRTPRFEQTP